MPERMKVKNNVRRSEEYSHDFRKLLLHTWKLLTLMWTTVNPSCACFSLLQMESKPELLKNQLFPCIEEGANRRSLTMALLRAEASSKRTTSSKEPLNLNNPYLVSMPACSKFWWFELWTFTWELFFVSTGLKIGSAVRKCPSMTTSCIHRISKI